MKELSEQLINTVKELFEKKTINYFIGYKKNQNNLLTEPVILSSINECNQLVFNQYCPYNLVKYLITLKNRKGKIGIILKGCDARAFNVLLMQNQISRDKIFTIGIECKG
ncbi:4Fe-4S ferredoxin, partial [candidate division KSB1 bacterium]